MTNYDVLASNQQVRETYMHYSYTMNHSSCILTKIETRDFLLNYQNQKEIEFLLLCLTNIWKLKLICENKQANLPAKATERERESDGETATGREIFRLDTNQTNLK